MGTFQYRAKKDTEGFVDGQIDAQTEQEAIEKVSQLGYLPVKITRIEESEEASPSNLSRARGRIKSRHVTLFSRELGSLIRSGVPILRGLSIIAEQTESSKFRLLLNQIHDNVEDGTTFSAALEEYPKVFSYLYISIIHAGENSGALPEALFRIAEYRMKQEEFLARFRMALVYPALMAVVGIGTVIFMLGFVIPRLTEMFLRIGQELPMPTKILIAISMFLRQWWFWILLGIVFMAVIITRTIKTESGKLAWNALKLRIPLFGKIVLKSELARFCRTLELLTRNGVTILSALGVAIPVLNNEVLKRALHESYQDLEEGGAFGQSLKGKKIFPLFMANLLTVGEETGSLDDALSEVASSYERDTDEAARMMTNLIEPAMILVMGVIVGFIVMAMLLPIFEINL